MDSSSPSASDASTLSFRAKLEARVQKVNSLLCIGLDPHFKELFPPDGIVPTHAADETKLESSKASASGNNNISQLCCDAAFSFCKTIIDATLPYAACYKPNAAFFEALGDGGMACLRRVVCSLPPDVPVLLDVKRGDIGSTAAAYATACYEYLPADAVTLSPLMGWDSVEPFVTGEYGNKGAFLLCKTSNPGSNDLLAQKLAGSAGAPPQTVYERIAELVGGDWSDKVPESALLGLVVGATDPAAMRRARQACTSSQSPVWILAPGVGAQGGPLEATVRAGLDPATGMGLLLPVSRGISRAADPAAAAKELQEQMEQVRQQVMKEHKAEQQQRQKDDSHMLHAYQRDFIEFSLRQGVLKFGSFVLKSGRTSPYFFNAGLFCSGASLSTLGKAYAACIMGSPELAGEGNKVQFDVVFGPAYKGISLGAVVCSALYSEYGVDVGFCYNRKEAKDHGEGGTLVGADMEGKRVLIVDDVITAGTAIRESHTMLKAVQAQPVGVVIALDRAEKRSLEDPVSAVQAAARDLDLPVVSIVNLPQLQIFLEKSSDYSAEVLESVIKYRNDYGV